MSADAEPLVILEGELVTEQKRRLKAERAAGKTTEKPKWNRAQRRDFARHIATLGRSQMRLERTAVRIRRRKAERGYSRASAHARGLPVKSVGFDWGAVVRASERKK